MLRCEMRRKLDEAWPEAIAQCEQARDEIIRRALAVVEAPKMRDDLREFGTKPEPLRRRIRPFFHLGFIVYAVVRRIEFNRTKDPAVGLREQPARCFFRVRRTHPSGDVPRRSSCIHSTPALGGINVPVALRKGKVRRGEPSKRREFAKLHAHTKLDRLAMNCRMFDAS